MGMISLEEGKRIKVSTSDCFMTHCVQPMSILDFLFFVLRACHQDKTDVIACQGQSHTVSSLIKWWRLLLSHLFLLLI